MIFDLSKDWRYVVRATPSACEEAFRAAFTEPSFSKGKWVVTTETPDEPSPDDPDHLVVAELVGTNWIRGLTTQGRTLGAAVAFGVFERSEERGATRCAMAIVDDPRYRTPRMIAAARANPDMIKSRMKLVTKKLRILDPQLEFAKKR